MDGAQSVEVEQRHSWAELPPGVVGSATLSLDYFTNENGWKLCHKAC